MFLTAHDPKKSFSFNVLGKTLSQESFLIYVQCKHIVVHMCHIPDVMELEKFQTGSDQWTSKSLKITTNASE